MFDLLVVGTLARSDIVIESVLVHVWWCLFSQF